MNNSLAIDGGTPVRRLTLPLIKPSYGFEELQEILAVFKEGEFCSVSPAAGKVRQLEEDFARYVGAKYAVAFSSGTTAQHASLWAIGIDQSHEVIVPPLTFVSTAYTVLLCRGTVVFAEVDEGTFNLDPDDVRRKITPRTAAIVPVHWFGRPADMDPILKLAQEHNLTVIEDCAHAMGTTYRGRPAGTMGAMACWSLQQSKLITAAGEGGMLTTDDRGLAEAARQMRDHGKSHVAPDAKAGRLGGYRIVTLGNNYRMTEIQAAFAVAQLRKIDDFRARRKAHTEYLDARLQRVSGLVRQAVDDAVGLSYAYYPIRFRQSSFPTGVDRISLALDAEGIGNYAIGREELCHVHPLFADQPGAGPQRYGPAALPVAEQIARELLILPLYPDLSRQDLDDVVAAVRKVAEAYAARAD